jgi:uncharacterized tellurite resistance protein B-like protein
MGKANGHRRTKPPGGLKALLASAAAGAAPLVQRAVQRFNAAIGYEDPLIAGSAAREINFEERAVRALRDSDPEFSAEVFKDRARLAFGKVIRAFGDRNLQAVRPFISDGVHERMLLQIREQEERGLREAIDNVEIGRVVIADADLGTAFQNLAVRIEATLVRRRSTVGAGDGPAGRDAASPERLSEVWSFVRSAGVRTRPGQPGLIEGSCPNCGAGVEISQHDLCPSCRSLLRSGRHDWVLAEIVQESAWSPPRLYPIRGLRDLLLEDPAFSVQQAEDRASVLFWRWQRACRLASPEPLLPVATQGMLRGFSEELAGPAAGGPRTCVEGCTVGDVELRGVRRAGPVWKLAVIVDWSGRLVAVRGGQPQSGLRHWGTHSIMVLVRDAGVRSDPDRALSSAHCPSCGAPELGLSGTCSYCGKALNSPSRGWMLEAVFRCSSTAGQAAMKELIARGPAATPRRGPAAVGLVAWMIKVAAADGCVGAEEDLALRSLASARGVGGRLVDEMIAAAAAGSLEAPAPADRAEAMEWLRSAIGAALADGRLERSEINALCAMAEKAGISEKEVLLLASAERTEAIRRAHDELGAARRAGTATLVAEECRRRRSARRLRFD